MRLGSLSSPHRGGYRDRVMSAMGRNIRTVATATIIVLLLLGTFWGQDDHFPLGPFRMYSTRNSLDGRVNAARLELSFSNGDVVETGISPRSVGLRRAEIEGQQDRFEARPQLLRHLADAYESLHPEAPPIVGVRMLDVIVQLRDGRPSGGPVEQTLATWQR